jgi:hypothetical protein
MTNSNLYVYRNGKAVVRNIKTPADAIFVASGCRKVLQSCLTAGCRLSYDGKSHFINGINPATNDKEAMDALVLFGQRVKRKLSGQPFFEVRA